MIKKICFFLLFALSGFASELDEESQPELIVNNRILATVHGKNISVVDVMKKMDVYLAKNHPDQAKSHVQRFQFFQTNWRHILKQMIDNELILADAEKLELKITDAEIRETIHERFGPNVMASLDQIGISYEEAWQMIYSEMAVQRLSWYRVHSKAMQKIGPQDIKKAFQEHHVKNPPKENWKYQVLSIRATTEKLGSIYAQKAYALIRNEPLPFEILAQKLKEENDFDSSITINVSEEYDIEGKNLSESHKAILCNLSPNSYSVPTAQVSRFDQSIVHRIFYLKEHTVEHPPTFDSMVDTLHDELVQEEINKEFPKYLSKLRKTFNFDEKNSESLPYDFQPFSLR